MSLRLRATFDIFITFQKTWHFLDVRPWIELHLREVEVKVEVKTKVKCRQGTKKICCVSQLCLLSLLGLRVNGLVVPNDVRNNGSVFLLQFAGLFTSLTG